MKYFAGMVIAVAWMATAADAAAPEEARHRALDAMFQQYNAPGTPGMSVGVYSQGKVDFLGGYGLADLEHGTRITPQTQFHVASVSKQFAAFAIALLQQDGKLKTTDPVRQWLPYVPDFGRPMQIQHLIHHTSGLRDQWTQFQLGGLDYSGVLLQQQVVNMVSRQRGLNFPVGTEYSYSNTGYTLLAEVVREASGKTFRQFTDERIFAPLGMRRSFFYDDLAELVPGRANSYSKWNTPRWQRELLNMETYGATSLFTTVEDLVKWAANFSQPEVGDASLIKLITTPGKLDDGSPVNYAYGLRREPFAGHEAIAHTGHDAAFNTVFAYFPGKDFAVVILANQPARLFPHLEDIVRLYLGQGPLGQPGDPAPETRPANKLLSELRGTYLAEYGALVSLDSVGDGLIWNSRSASDDRPGRKLVFRRDGSFDLGGRTRGFNFYRLRRDASGKLDGFDLVSNVGGQKTLAFRRAQAATPALADLQSIAGDYYSAELDATYTFSVENGALTARSLWLKSPITFVASAADRFDSGEGLLPTIVIERDAEKRPQRIRIQGEYTRNMLLERRAANTEDIRRQAGVVLRQNYTKHDFNIPMRDGVKLYTIAYVPKDVSARHGILLERTPYGITPDAPDGFPSPLGGPLFHYPRENFIFVYQDVRGRYQSEGEFVHLRPYQPVKSGPKDIDESTDAYDTLEWLTGNLPSNNGRACLLGISYAGFYSAMAAIDPHPSLKCVSPQAPATDWFMGDDFRHNGALFLTHAYRFFFNFNERQERPAIADAYSYFLKAGSLTGIVARDFKDDPFLKSLIEHDTYDEFWQERSLARHAPKMQPAVLTVGGWFDAENLYGALNLHRSLEASQPRSSNLLVMGPWAHGEWSWRDGTDLGAVSFGGPTSDSFRRVVELPFLKQHLNGTAGEQLPKAYMFETGASQWRSFETWPPTDAKKRSLYLSAGGQLRFEASSASPTFDEFVSDPAHPVPFVANASHRMAEEYMVDDQRFAAARPDVLIYQTDALPEALTVAGPISVELLVSTSGTDADWIVKVIDVYPASQADPQPNPARLRMAGYQQLVRGEPMRGKFREGFDKTVAFTPNEPTLVRFTMPDVFHTFKSGHRLMVQVQSSWFPLIDRNPQVLTRISEAKPEEYQRATQRVFHSSRLLMPVLEQSR